MGELGQVMRVVRTLLLASTSLSLAALAHGLGGGELPGLGAMVALGILTVSASCLVAQARPRVWTLVPFLGAVQFFLHHAMAWSATATASGLGTAQPFGHAGHHSGAAVTAAVAPTSHTALAGAQGHLANPRMVVLHLAAILVTAVLMAVGEATTRVALQVFRHVVPELTAPRMPTPDRPRVHPRPAVLPTPLSVLLARSTPRRGPPVASVVPA
ncbi:hypothetical protein [Myceligenerans indicum]|uniref:MFS transporter n=1 Tax=Myceligenerans indicum TaxID=2593663 RepID=A0ABS1LJG8_9MICO|nr:hypothetical protein [Myceligenerans indicum]MBL0885707.1 hypothetical protein [Myceligenerans indicum]